MLAMLLSSSVMFASTSQKSTVMNDRAAVYAAEKNFYGALNAIFVGNLNPMKEVWSHTEDDVYMGPDGGVQVGWRHVLQDWEKQASLNLGGRVTPHRIKMTIGKEVSVVCNEELGSNRNEHGKVKQVSLRATNIYRKEDGVWKMIGHHTDKMNFLVKEFHRKNLCPLVQ